VSEIIEIRRKVVGGLLEFSGLNVVYDSNQAGSNNWAQDGAFMTRARDFGVESHVPALKNLIDEIRHNTYLPDLEILSERMWSYGHPMMYIDHRI
jgi:hypothetical protein